MSVVLVFSCRRLCGGVGELCEQQQQRGVPAPREDQRAAGPSLSGAAPAAGRPEGPLVDLLQQLADLRAL